MDMSPFITQHAEAAGVIGEIETLMQGGTVQDADKIRALLSTLVGKLSVHLAIEDKNIYPKAKESENATLKALAEEMESSMAGLAQDLMAYSTKWASAIKINENTAEFITETKGVFDALKKRIELEETKFYPLVAENM